MRVVHATTAHAADDVRIFHKECRSLAAAGHEVFLIARGAVDDTVDGVRRLPIGEFGGRRERMLGGPGRVRRLLRSLGPDVVHVHDPELVPLALWLRLTTRARIVIDVHEDLRLQVRSKPWIPAPLRGAAVLFAVLLDRVIALAAHRVITATQAIARRYPPAKTAVVHNFPMQEELAAVESRPWQERTPELLFVGGLSEIRGAAPLFDALLEPPLADARLLVIGKADAAVEARLAAHPARDRIEVTGWLERAAMPALIGARGRVGLVPFLPVPNHTEALPNKLFEYMAWGLPVVASDFPLWREIVETAGSGRLADPTDPAALAAAVHGVLEYPEQAATMAESGRRAIREHYSWEAQATVLRGVYAEAEGPA